VQRNGDPRRRRDGIILGNFFGRLDDRHRQRRSIGGW
jgi:hypothetical protein